MDGLDAGVPSEVCLIPDGEGAKTLATIEQLAGEFARIRKPESKLILTGFPEWDIPEGFEATETRQREEWVCLVIDRPAAS